MGYLETSYALKLAARLRNFKQKSNSIIFSCPFCGDSASDERRARGYLYEKEGEMWYFCHNQCGGMMFSTFLNRLDTSLYHEYKLERLAVTGTTRDLVDKTFKVKVKFDTHPATEEFRRIKTVSALAWDHPAKQYIVSRQIPNHWHSHIRWVDKFQTWVNNVMLPGKYEDLRYDEGRLVIPFMTEKKQLFAYLGRAISNNPTRYMLNVLDHSEPLIWGRDHVDIIKRKGRIPVTEGPIDAMFLRGLSMNGGNFAPLMDLAPREKFTLVFDNEPRSTSTKKKMVHAIENGFSICVWPKSLEYKDINQMVTDKYTADQIVLMISQNTFAGTAAKIKVQDWSKAG